MKRKIKVVSVVCLFLIVSVMTKGCALVEMIWEILNQL